MRTTQIPPMLKVVYSDERKEEEKFQQSVYVNCKHDERVHILDVMNSVFDKVIANQPICNVYKKQLQLFTRIIYSFYSGQDELEHWRQ